MIPLILAGCTGGFDGRVEMYGIVTDAPRAEGAPVADAALEILDVDLEPFASATSASDGSFVVDVPKGETFFLQAAAEGFVPTAFSGSAGQYDLYAGDGLPWLPPTAWLDALRAEFAGCPDAELGGVVVTGEVRLYIADYDYQQLPLVTTATVTVYPETGEAHEACYLADDGSSPDAGSLTGDTGRFAVFGVAPGPVIVEVVYDDGSTTLPAMLYQYVAVADGLVPMYPAMVYVAD